MRGGLNAVAFPTPRFTALGCYCTVGNEQANVVSCDLKEETTMGRKWECVGVPIDSNWFTFGKVYEESTTGSVIDDQGYKWGRGIEDPSKYGGYKFKEVTMGVKEKIRNGSFVKLSNDRYYVAMIGGVYGTPGILHQIGDDDFEHIKFLEEDRIEAIYEARDEVVGINEMIDAVEGEYYKSNFNLIYEKTKVKELTVADVEKILGYKVKIVKEDK